jgi:hypothetical protein
MCRSIKTLRTGEGRVPDEEVEAAALQFVRKVSGYRHPSKANQEVFDRAVDQVAGVTRSLLESLVVNPRQKERTPA